MTWRPVVGFEYRYEVSRTAEQVRSRQTGRVLACRLIAGKSYVQLRVGTNHRTDRAVARLIAEAFEEAAQYRENLVTAEALPEPTISQDLIPGERWRPVVEGEDEYDVSDYGRVRKQKASHKSPAGHILTPGDCQGYRNVVLYRDGKRTTRNVHTLVARAFLGPPPSPKHQVNHKDRKRSNNRLTNLEWETPKKNTQHAHRTGPPIVRAGERNPGARLAESDIRRIRKLAAQGLSSPQIAECLGGVVHRVTIRDIVAGRTWTHVK